MNLIIHPDELILKGKNQSFFYNTLIKNLQKTFKDSTFKRIEGGIWAENFKEVDLKEIKNIPGINNFAVCYKSKAEIEDVKKTIDELIKNLENKPETFRASAKRIDKNFPTKSQELNIILGDYVNEKYGFGVKLKKPDLEIHISIYKQRILTYGNTVKAVGGLPVGSSGKVLSLLSGGIDSPVASYTLLKRGAEIGLIHFQNETHASEEVGEKIFDLAKKLAKYQSKIKLFIVPFGEIQKQVIMKVPADYRMIISRRIFYKIAERVASENKYLALATGDSLGQVASQTLENMSAIYQATDILKLTPLITLNKSEIIKIARDIETIDISERPYEDCCSLFVARHPQTKAKLKDVLEIEKQIDNEVIDNVEIISYNISIN